MARFEWDPSTVKVDWALDGAIPWENGPATRPGTVHIASSVDEIATNGAEISAGTVPAQPFMLLGQMGVADPSRVADGR